MTDQLALDLGLVTVHCYDQRCGHTVTAASPGDAHAAMERHYDERHAAYIRAVTR